MAHDCDPETRRWGCPPIGDCCRPSSVAGFVQVVGRPRATYISIAVCFISYKIMLLYSAGCLRPPWIWETEIDKQCPFRQACRQRLVVGLVCLRALAMSVRVAYTARGACRFHRREHVRDHPQHEKFQRVVLHVIVYARNTSYLSCGNGIGIYCINLTATSACAWCSG